MQVGTLRQALQIKAAELSKQAGADIHSRLLYAVAKVGICCTGTSMLGVTMLAHYSTSGCGVDAHVGAHACNISFLMEHTRGTVPEACLSVWVASHASSWSDCMQELTCQRSSIVLLAVSGAILFICKGQLLCEGASCIQVAHYMKLLYWQLPTNSSGHIGALLHSLCTLAHLHFFLLAYSVSISANVPGAANMQPMTAQLSASSISTAH